MKATILTIGTEILFGSITNTNSVYLSQQLQNLGVDVLRHITVGDNEGRLLKALEYAYEDSDLVLTTGGLGPTEDDLTKETITKYFGTTLKEDPEQLSILKGWYAKQNRVMARNNIKQAWLPEGSEVLPNPNGTAPGFYYTDGKRHIYVMPGPPRENIPMFRDYVAPKLAQSRDGYLYYKMIRTIGIGESDLEMALIDLIDGQTDPTIATYAKQFSCAFRVTSKRATLEESKAAVEEMMQKIRPIVGKYIYSEEDEELLQVDLRMLKERGEKLACAESMTGGQFAKSVTDIPGASAVFYGGKVTYCNPAKTAELCVKPDTLDKYGAVSAQTAEEMVRGLYLYTGCSCCISVTGLAGPDPDEGKPVGLFYVGLMYRGKVTVREFRSHQRTRTDIRNFACIQMARMIYKALNND